MLDFPLGSPPHAQEIAEPVKEKITVFATIIPSVLILDFITKRWALTTLGGGNRLEIMGGFVPLSLAYNRGAAFGISLGDDSRWFFIPITILALTLLLVLLKQAGVAGLAPSIVHFNGRGRGPGESLRSGSLGPWCR